MDQIKRIFTWPEFQVTWILAALVLAAIAMTAAFVPSPISWVSIALLLIVLILVFTSMYKSASIDRDTNVERNELKSILASINDALIVYERDFKVIFFNPAAERMFKLQAKNVLGHAISPRDIEREGWRVLTQVMFPSLAPRVISRSKEGDLPQIVDASFTDPPLEFRIATAPVADENGNTLAFLKIIRDRTAQITAIRSRSEFITVASHQLRGPVTDINWALQSLSSANELSDTNKLIVENAAAASNNLLRRIEDLLNIAKMEDGQFGYQFKEASVEDFISTVLTDVLPAANKAGIKIFFDRPQEPLPHVMIDAKRLSLALVNLLENAIRYNIENGEVFVKADVMPGKPFLVVSVRDTGIGIPPEAREKLFTKFYRADNALKLQTEGSGLGLYIAKSIVAAHGGQIWVDSEFNRGTTVSFALPTDPELIPKREMGIEDLF
ncbi:MAG TPA: HAMP domain-containing sensor histidine kinase [Candidatus Paceibacterota bacterium]|nr:HAMP domain-containing sensor histidine kinase [Candidatus Paceibacterota bacterium]